MNGQKSIFHRAMNALIDARQREANRFVAQYRSTHDTNSTTRR